MSVHTPGPWEVDQASVHAQWTDSLTVVDQAGAAICHTTRGGFFYAEPDPRAGDQSPAYPNAHLIAAAPELLKLARAVAEFFDGTDALMGAAARDVIAKAEGRS